MDRKELSAEDTAYIEKNPHASAAAGINDDVQLDIWQRETDTIVGVKNKHTGQHLEFWKLDGTYDATDIQAEYLDANSPQIDPAEDAGDAGDAEPAEANS